MKKRLTMLIIAGIMAGCGTTNCVYPTFPKPSQYVLNTIKSNNSMEVDKWMLELYKLKLKLEVK